MLVDRSADRNPDPTRPQPRVLQFLPDPFSGDSVSRMPRLEPVQDSQKLPVSVGVHTNVYSLRSAEDEDTPARPLPAVSLELLQDLETRKLRGRDKVMTRESLTGLGVDVRSFSSDDFEFDVDDLTHEGGFEDPDSAERERHGRSPAAVALPALSDEMELDPVDADFSSFDDLDELAAQLGLHGVSVPRSTPPHDVSGQMASSPIPSLDDLDEVESDDVELVAVASPSKSDPFGAVVMGRLAQMPSLDTGLAAALEDDLGFDDDNDVTPARGTPRPAITAPQAVRFVVAEAPARPRHESLSAEEKARNRVRARDLYLVAMDDLGDGDKQGAIVHLELAIAYDDETSLYLDLLGQLKEAQAKRKKA